MGESMFFRRIFDAISRRLPGFSGITVAAALLATGALLLMLCYAPFYLPSYLFWTGFLIILAGAVSLLVPLQFLLIRSRGMGGIVLLCGLVASLCGLFWPVGGREFRPPIQRLDRFLPAYSFSEYYEVRVRAEPGRVMEAARRVSFADLPTARLLLRLRASASGKGDRRWDPEPWKRPILETFHAPGSGFLVIDSNDPRELIYGMAGRPWRSEAPPRIVTPEEFLAFQTAGHIRVAFNFRVKGLRPGLTLLSTETRIQGNDALARRIFGRYWHVIYPGSAIIRKVWLDAIARLAEKS